MERLFYAQTYRNASIVEAKREAEDYRVQVITIDLPDGSEARLIVDGHHSFEAAKLDGVQPELECWNHTPTSQEYEFLGLDDFLTQHGWACLYDAWTDVEIDLCA